MPKKAIPVLCTTTGKRFISLSEAEKTLGINRRLIKRACTGRQHHTHGLKFQYVDVDKQRLYDGDGEKREAIEG